jgi:hypothetical protein
MPGSGGTQSTGGAASGGGATGTGGTGTIGCDRAGLEAAVNSYLAALGAGNPASMPLTSSASYLENDATVALGQGLWLTPLQPDFHRNLLDVDSCASFTEVIIASGSHPYVLGVRLRVTGAQISEVYVVATDQGDWGFNAADYLRYSQAEDWSLVPADQRLTRQQLHDAGFAYFAFWGDKTVQVPWGSPCARLEGGLYTGDYPGSSCSIGIPDGGFAPQPRDYLVDVDYGMVVLFLNLGGTDTHLFRVLSTGIRYVHTLTVQ